MPKIMNFGVANIVCDAEKTLISVVLDELRIVVDVCLVDRPEVVSVLK